MNAVDSAKQLLLQSGVSWILWLLAGLSAASLLFKPWSVGCSCARATPIWKRSPARWPNRWARENVSAAIARLESFPTLSTATAIAASGLKLADLGPASVDKAMQSTVAIESGSSNAAWPPSAPTNRWFSRVQRHPRGE